MPVETISLDHAKETLEKMGFNLAAKEPSTRWIDQKSILCGIAKCGKSNLLAQAGETNFFFRLAPEFTNLKTFGVDCRDFEEVEKNVGRLVQAHQQNMFIWDTLTFDPGDRLLDFIAEAVSEHYEADSVGDVPHGKGWAAYKQKIRAFVYSLEALPAHKFFVFHSQTKEFPETGQEHERNPKTYSKEIVALSDKTESVFAKWVDNILHIKTGYVGDKEERVILTRGN